MADPPIQRKTTFIYNGNNGLSWQPISLPSTCFYSSTSDWPYSYYRPLCNTLESLARVAVFAISYIYLLILSFYHYHSSHFSQNSTHWIATASFSQFLCHSRLPSSFCHDILIPLFASVATCSPQEVLEYPAAEFLVFIVKTFGQNHYTLKGGIHNAINGLLVDIRQSGQHTQIHLNCTLTNLRVSDDDKVKLNLSNAQGQSWQFDHVIFATQANQARHLMSTYLQSLSEHSEANQNLINFEKRRIEALGTFQYTHSVVVNHYDAKSTIGDNTQDRRMLNLASWENVTAFQAHEKLHYDASKQVSIEHVMATHDLSILHPALRSPTGSPLLQTTNPIVLIAEDSIVSRRVFERAIVTSESKEALKGFLICDGDRSYQGRGNIWFVGAWAAEVSLPA